MDVSETRVGEERLTWGRPGGVLTVADGTGRPLLEEAPGPGVSPLSVAGVSLSWFPVLAWWEFRSKVGRWRGALQVLGEAGDWLSLGDGNGKPLVEVRESTGAPGVVEGEIRMAPGVSADWVRWRVKARPDERFLGFGERFNGVDQRGNRLFVWTEEGAVGLGERLGRWLDGVSWNPFPNGPATAYKPMPFYISSDGYGLLLETFARVEYDVAASDPGVVEIVVWDGGFRWVLFHGPTPAEIITRFTERTGRSTVPAAWVFAPWNDAIYGSDSVLRTARKLREEKIPTTAVWTEDWQGGYWLPPFLKKRANYIIFPLRYHIDRHLYPDLEEVADELHGKGFRWLSYFLPYIVRNSKEYREAEARGYLLKNRKGGVSKVMVLWHPYGHIDLTNPAAREWYMGLLEENFHAGFDGWMADFGEYVPPGSVTSTGETGLIHHNRFPLLWQQMHRELMDRLRPDGDYVFFCRSATVGSQRYAPVFWSGDSNTDFERYDGLPSNIPAAISAGLCGLPLWAADIGGYMSVTTRGRDKELYLRWTELAALLPIMRTHHGTHPRRNWQFDSDRETLEHFRDYCRLHTALFPFIYGLAHEASRSGLPAVRHLVLHFPEDRHSWAVEDQFLLGDRLLVAPVVTRNSRGRTVYFPPGAWVDYWTGRRYRGPAETYVGAPPGVLPFFARSGTVVPTLDMPVDTLAPADQGTGLVGLEEALQTLRLTMYGEGEESHTMHDGTRVRMWRAHGKDALSLSGAVVKMAEGDLEAAAATDGLQPARMRSGPDQVVSANGKRIDLVVLADDGQRLAGASLEGGPPRSRVTFEWR